jgi:O-antigen/teichoic acid export membrane protein
VMFPVYTRIRDSRAALREGCAEAMKLITLASAPVCIGVAAVIPAAELVIFRGKWWDLPAPLAFMMLRTLQRAVGSMAGDIYKATGRPSIIQVFFGVRFLLEMIFVFSGAMLWGLAGAGLGELIASSLALGLEMWALRRRIGVTAGMVLDAVKVPVTAACLAGIVANVFLWRGALGPTVWGLAAGVAAGAAVYLSIISTLERPMMKNLRDAVLGRGAVAPAPESLGQESI